MTKSEEWDDQDTPRRRFNPLPLPVIVIGLAVFLAIVFGYQLVKLI